MGECYECGTSNNLEEHHCVFRSQSKVMINIYINKIKLCAICHRGNLGPHKNRSKDLEYKLLIQNKLFKLFTKDYYLQKEIKELLDTNTKTVYKITKTLALSKEGYLKEDIIRQCMGGKFY